MYPRGLGHFAEVSSAEKLSELRAELVREVSSEKPRQAKLIVGNVDDQREAERVMPSLTSEPAFAAMLLNPDIDMLALLQNHDLLLVLADPGVRTSLANVPKAVLASLADPSIAALLASPGFLQLITTLSPETLTQLAATGVLADPSLLAVLTELPSAAALVAAASDGALTPNVLEVLSTPAVAVLLSDPKIHKSLVHSPAHCASVLAAIQSPASVGALLLSTWGYRRRPMSSHHRCVLLTHPLNPDCL